MPKGKHYRCGIVALVCAGFLAGGVYGLRSASAQEIEIWMGKSKVQRPRIGTRSSATAAVSSPGEPSAPAAAERDDTASAADLAGEPRILPTLLEEEWRSVSRLTNEPYSTVNSADDTSYATMQAIFNSELVGRRGHDPSVPSKERTEEKREAVEQSALSGHAPRVDGAVQSPQGELVAQGLPQPAPGPWVYATPPQVVYQMPPQIIYQMPPQVAYRMPASVMAIQNASQGVPPTSNQARWTVPAPAQQTGPPAAVQAGQPAVPVATINRGPSRTERVIVICLLLVAAFLGAYGLQPSRLRTVGRGIRRRLSLAFPERAASTRVSSSEDAAESAEETLVNRVISENVNLRRRVGSSA